MKKCPNCLHGVEQGRVECINCGIIFDKYYQVRDRQIKNAEKFYKEGRLDEAKKEFIGLLTKYSNSESELKYFLGKIEKEYHNISKLKDAENIIRKTKNYTEALKVLNGISSECDNIEEKKTKLINEAKKKQKNKKFFKSSDHINQRTQASETNTAINGGKAKLLYVLTPVSLFVVLIIVGFLFLKTEQKILFIAEKISYKKDTLSFICQSKCSDLADSGPIQKYLTNGWEIVSSTSKSVIAEDFHIETSKHSVAAYGCECIGHEYILKRKLIDKIF